MFRNSLKYYHGTTKKKWKIIKKSKKFIPSHIKEVGEYWVTKGVYFVCENPYIALWYAHLAALSDNSEPVVLCLEYEADKKQEGKVLNLLPADGHKLLAMAHDLYSKKLSSMVEPKSKDEKEKEKNNNLDSVTLQLLMDNSKHLNAIIASFQEGKSYQNMVHSNDYKNKFVPDQKGLSPGDHVEICFYPDLQFEESNIHELSKDQILENSGPYCIWPHVCEGLTEVFAESDFKEKLKNSLSN